MIYSLRTFCVGSVLTTLLLAGCNQGPNKEEIAALCKAVGDQAFVMANTGRRNFDEVTAIEKGAVAECKLKYMTGK
jgi:50S ribosomal subunit-associated GTPase HflX